MQNFNRVKRFIYIFSILFFTLFINSFRMYGQITDGFINNGPPGSDIQGNQQDTTEYEGSSKPTFGVKRFFKALAHKDSMNVGQMGIGSMILPGTAQIYNKQYWKLPIVYGTIGGCIAGAYTTKDKSAKKYFIAGAVACYWGSVMDGVISYKSTQKPLPARASMFSALLPGLGQAYNGDYWKIPIFYTGFVISGYAWAFNQTQYQRYRNIYSDISAGTYQGHLSEQNAKWYRDKFRRYRDYSIIATALIYALNIIDANVFAHFSSFDISDDITFNVEPTIITPLNNYSNFYANNQQPVGFKINLIF